MKLAFKKHVLMTKFFLNEWQKKRFISPRIGRALSSFKEDFPQNNVMSHTV